eukprot:7622461-Pyramimonas_sp.AAC.1
MATDKRPPVFVSGPPGACQWNPLGLVSRTPRGLACPQGPRGLVSATPGGLSLAPVGACHDPQGYA